MWKFAEFDGMEIIGLRRTPRGFSILEVMVGIGFLMVSFLALTSLSRGTVGATEDARHISAATNLARSKIEELRGLSYATVATGADAAKLSERGQSASPGAIYARSWTVTTGPAPGTKSVTVTVKWNDSATGQISLATLVGQ
jgi:Tfp pilus assembly protein PilV